MKAICLKNINHEGKVMRIEIGTFYTVSQCPVYPNNYDLAEIPTTPSGRPVSYRKYFFAHISEIDETDFSRTYNEEKA